MYKKYSTIIWATVLVALISGSAIAYNQLSKNTPNGNIAITPSPSIDVGVKPTVVPAPIAKSSKNANGKPLISSFTLSDINGNKVSLSDFADKVVVLNFWASWCPPCKSEMPEFNQLSGELDAMGDAVLLTINQTDGQRETKDKAIKFLKDNGYTFKTLLDEGLAVGDMFGITGIPATFVIDKDGYLSDYIVGATTKANVLRMVNGAKI